MGTQNTGGGTLETTSVGSNWKNGFEKSRENTRETTAVLNLRVHIYNSISGFRLNDTLTFGFFENLSK